MIYQFKNSIPRWINFENKNGEAGNGGIENNGAKGHAFEKFDVNEEKVLCDLDGSGVVRKIWITLRDRSPQVLQNVYIRAYWDNSDTPQVNVPIGDFACMGTGEMKGFENRFFSTAEGRSIMCTVPMPFKNHAKITLLNASGIFIKNLFYDIDLTLEDLDDDVMYFHADFSDIPENELESDVEILNCKNSKGRFLGTNITVFPNENYRNLWWGEGEVKIYLDGDTKYATLVGTGAEDYVGSAWELGEFINATQGCVTKTDTAVSMYRFHDDDPIYFKNGIKVTLQAMGGGTSQIVKELIANNVPLAPVSYSIGGIFHKIYKTEYNVDDLDGYVCFFRQDRYRTVAYYYLLP